MGRINILVVTVILLLGILAVHQANGGLLYVGTESTPLYVLNFDEASGKISLKSSTSIVANPSFIALHVNGQYLYTVSEVETFNRKNNSGGIAAYKIDRETGALTLINSVPSLGADPAHIGLDRTNKWIGVANYDSGNYGVWKIEEDFSIAEKPISFFQDKGKGPMPQQDGPHAHEFVFDHSNKYVVVPDLGNDHWMLYSFSPDGVLLPFSNPSVVAPAGSGPRHFAFHPTLQYAYGVSEIASTVTVFRVDPIAGLLIQLQRISSLPSVQPSDAAELQFSHDGRVLYVSNRLIGVNGTIAIFNIDQTRGTLTNIGYAGTQGIHPRFFNLSKDGRFILVANQLSNNIRVFERNAVSGLLGAVVGSLDNIAQPSHILQL